MCKCVRSPFVMNIFQHFIYFHNLLNSLFMTSFGGKHNRRKKPRPSPQTRTYCKGMKWLDKYQRNLCYHFPEIIPLIKDGVKHALKECRRQFISFRWNCSSLDWKEVLNDGGILKKRKSYLFLYTIDSNCMNSNDVVSERKAML